MAQFTLNWFATAVMTNTNATGQRALYRQKSVGGSFLSTGFTPANDLPKTTQSVTSPVLGNNIVWEFKVQALCTEGGPTDNDNGIIEAIQFECLTPLLTQTEDTAGIVLNVSGLDITKAAFTLIQTDGDPVVVSGPTIVNRIGNSITHSVTGLTDGTEYYWEVVLYATINGVEVNSALPAYLGTACTNYSFETDTAACNPITGCDADAIEV